MVADTPSEPEFLENFQVLKYMEVLLEVHRYAASLSKKRMSPPDKWPAKIIQDAVPANLINEIVEHFFPDLRITDFSMIRLRTYILALTLRIPPGLAKTAGPGILATEPSDIYIDLALDHTRGTQLFRELGCKVESAKEAEMQRWGLNKLMKRAKDEGGRSPGKVRVAKLTLPLDFPKVSQGRAPNTKKRY